MRKDVRSWSLLAGGLLILAAWLIAYLVSQPAEADISMLREIYCSPQLEWVSA